MNRHPTEADWDHARDLRKHAPRPGERDYVPLSAEPAPMTTAMEIAVLVKAIPIQQGAELIERYVADVKSRERLDAVAAGARP